VAAFDSFRPEREGWFAGRTESGASVRSDDRFSEGNPGS